MTGALLELREADDAFARIEAFLGTHGFFRAGAVDDGRSADVYLGYGLSDPMRRQTRPAPPEPVSLPLAACRVRGPEAARRTARGHRIGAWQPTWTAAEHREAVARARAMIADGEVYQVNLVQHLSARFDGDPESVAASLAHLHPLVERPFEGSGWSVVSASPELFLGRSGRRVWTTPIKGTRPRGDADSLRSSPKDAAEHLMIVDLERNDLGRVCEPGSVRWPELMVARPMAGVEHLVSRVEGIVRDDVGWAQLMAAMFPGGSVTGAPKVAALDHISALEPVGRGASMGALGTIRPNGDFELALTIRTFAMAEGRIHLWVGGGVVWDSGADAEVEESWVKARPILEAVGGRLPAAAVPTPAVPALTRGAAAPAALRGTRPDEREAA